MSHDIKAYNSVAEAVTDNLDFLAAELNNVMRVSINGELKEISIRVRDAFRPEDMNPSLDPAKQPQD